MAEMLLQTLAAQARASQTYDDRGGGGGVAAVPPPPGAPPPPPPPPPAAPLVPSIQVCALLKMNLQMLAAQPALHPSAALRLLEFGSPFSNLRLHPCQSITSSVAATYVYFLQHGCDKVAVEAAMCLKREIEVLSKNLGKDAKAAATLGLVEAEVVSLLKFDLLLLLMSVRANAAESQVQKVKDIINFVLEKCDPFQSSVIRHCDLQLAVIQALRRVFSWIVPWEVDSGGVGSAAAAAAAGSAEFFGKCCGVMSRGLEKKVSSLAARIEVLDWIGEFPKWFRKVAGMDLFGGGGGLMAALVAAASDEEPAVRLQASKTFDALLRQKCLSSMQIYTVAEAAFEQHVDPDPGIRAAFSRVLATCSLGALWVHGWRSDSDGKEESISRPIELEKHWRYLLSVNRFATHLSPPQVVCILNYISQRQQSLPSGWQQRLVFNSLKLNSKKVGEDIRVPTKKVDGLDEAGTLEDRFDLVEKWCCSSEMPAAWFIVQELARHCITVRFRTHLGGPTQTFAALERMLLDLPQMIQPESGSIPSTSELLPMRLLLELVDSLQRNIYNAYEGSLVLDSPSFSSSIFFRANKKVCEEWFARIREALVNASSSIQCYFGTSQHSMFRLHDLRPIALAALRDLPRTQAADAGLNLKLKLQQDVLRMLRHGALALCKMRESDSILGLQAWTVSAFGGLINEDNHKVGSPTGPIGFMNGLALESRGEFERAAKHYSQLFESEATLSVLGADGVQFVIGRIVESYVSISDWESLEGWLIELQSLRAKHAGKSYTGALTTAGIDMNSIYALSRFDSGDVQGSWGYLDLTPQSNNEITIDPRQALQRSEQMLLQAMLRKDTEIEDSIRELKLARSMISGPMLVASIDDLRDAAPFLTQLHCIEVVESWRGLSDRRESIHDLSAQFFGNPVDEMDQDCQLWLKVLRVYKSAFAQSGVTSKLRQQLIRLARKHGNLRLARRLLSEMIDEGSDPTAAAYEKSLLLFSEGEHSDAMKELWPIVKNFVAESQQTLPFEDGGNLIAATTCLKLGSWLLKRRPGSEFGSLISESENESEVESGRVPDEVAGAAVKAATLHCPSFGKAWFCYASWCYSLARRGLFGDDTLSKASIFPQVLEKELGSCSVSLTEDETESIRTVLRSSGGEVEVLEDGILEMLVKRIVHLMESAARESGFEKWDAESLSMQLRQELQVLKGISVNLPGLINDLLQVWWDFRKRRITLFGYAAHGFLKYMSLSSRNTVKINSLKQDSTLSASLFVLNILQTCGVELEETLQQGLSSIPPSPWKEITPQLFACVSSHPEAKVRKQLEGLLMSLANVYPWAIVYPTLVHFNALEGQSSEELEHLLSSLSKLHPKVVNDVRLMIAELGSITFLWEEQWLTTLQDLHADVARRIMTLKEEAARIAENQTLTPEEKAKINAAKYTAIMAPVAFALERRLTLTSRPPETPHEAWFQEHFGGQLRSAITTFKLAPSGNTALNEVWKPFDAIASFLSSHHKRSAVVLKDVSPRLATLTQSDAPMPGLEFPDAEIVTVANFNEQITILATKTKPKKVSVTGSDGRIYNYLLKGREDLRLDARIMQILRASNKMLRASSGTRREGLAVKCYSVTPISGRAGLIQWVDNVTSLYSVFKAWQLRQQAAQLASNPVPAAPPPPLPRPSDMFYGKIIPALKEKGLRKVISRRDWPQDVKRKVLVELMKETPRQLLYRELWCASDGLKGFNKKIKRFSGSVAVMSMLGHVLGLGDRHLDNILIDFSTGDVVHIDYNICFEKGRRLKVPEIVPFRLTQTIQNALGPTGVEGSFRASCESVLRTLMKNKEVILMLLEAFVWDPLVEWMRGDDHDDATIGGEERKGMELAVSLSLFASHVQENRVALQEHHDQLLRTLPGIPSTLQAWAAGYEKFEICSTLAFRINQKKYSAEAAEVAARNLLAEASASLEKTHLTYEIQAREFAQSKALMSEAARETAQWIEQRSRVLDSLRTDSAEVQALGQLTHSTDSVSLLQAVIAAGVALTVLPETTQVHIREVDRDISQYTTARHEALLHARSTLQAYAQALQRLLPGNYYTTSYVHGWAKILQLLSLQVNPEVLSVSKRQAVEIIRGDHDEAIRQKHDKLRVHVERLGEEVHRLGNARAQLEESVDPDAEKRAKDKLMGIFVRSLQIGKNNDEDDAGYDPEERRFKVLVVLQSAASAIYSEIGNHAANLQGVAMESTGIQSWCFPELEGLVERAVLVSDVLSELQQVSAGYRSNLWDSESFSVQLKGFTDCLGGIDHLVKQMIGVVLPEAIKAALSQDPAVMEAFASLSQIRGAIDTTLEKVAEIEIQKLALIELEKTYPDKLEELVKRKTLLEEAAAGGRDDFSWEEAEELANQEDLCRDQLDSLQKAWSQRGAQASAVLRIEALVRSALASAEQRFETLVALDRDDLHLMRGKVLLAAFAKLFSGLESLDSALKHVPVAKIVEVESPGLEYIWRASSVLQQKTFFVWKVYVMDILLDSCVRDAGSDLSLSLDQLISQHKRRLESQLQGVLDLYLRERVSPAFLDIVLKEATGSILVADNGLDSSDAAKKAVKLLREYCDVHETVRAAKSAAFSLEIQADEAKQSFQNAQIEIARMEWLHDSALANHVQFVAMPGGSYSESIRWWNRKQILENIRNSIAAISRATEGLQKVERVSVSVEEQLERAMAWASNRSPAASQEFRDRLQRRKQLLWTGQEHATTTVRLCVTVLEFEASREGYLDSTSSSSSSDGKAWQQSYQSLILRLEAAYFAFTSCDLEWKSAQKALETASASLSVVLRELQLVSGEADSSGAELQSIFAQLRQLTIEAAEAVTSFSKVVRGHSALTSEGAVMLDEVLMLTEGAEGASDVHSLAKEAITERQRLITELRKVHTAVSTLESILPSTANAMTAELDIKAVIKSGQSPTLQSLDSKLKEALADLPVHVSGVLDSAQKLHSALTSLGRAASVDAGTLNKAFENMEESPPVSASTEYAFPSQQSNVQALANPLVEKSVLDDDDSWISPPGTQSGDSDYSAQDSTSTTQDHEISIENAAGIKPMGAESIEGQARSRISQHSLSSEGDKLHSGEAARPSSEPKQQAIKGNSSNALSANVDHQSRVVRGTAVNVLKGVRTKLEGRDIDDGGQLSVAEQVDHLLRQAMSIDNLCNMYEGWTPWI